MQIRAILLFIGFCTTPFSAMASEHPKKASELSTLSASFSTLDLKSNVEFKHAGELNNLLKSFEKNKMPETGYRRIFDLLHEQECQDYIEKNNLFGAILSLERTKKIDALFGGALKIVELDHPDLRKEPIMNDMRDVLHYYFPKFILENIICERNFELFEFFLPHIPDMQKNALHTQAFLAEFNSRQSAAAKP